VHTFRDVATAAYCPRKLYYRRRDGEPDVPDDVDDVRRLAFEYDELRSVDAALLAAPIEVSPGTYRERLGRHARRLEYWDALVDPPRRDALLTGRECRGIAHKVLEDPLVPALSFAGEPPDEGVWEPQTVRLVAAAKALSWEHETTVERAIAEYPAYGVVREIDLTVRRKAAYRRAVRTAETIDGPPARVDSDAKCAPCEYREGCGTTTRSLASMLGD
jgi:CRISPR-associated exonuclease Cas4